MAAEFSNRMLGAVIFQKVAGDIRVLSCSPIFDRSSLTETAQGDFQIDFLPGENQGASTRTVIVMGQALQTTGANPLFARWALAAILVDSGTPNERLRVLARVRDDAGAPVDPSYFAVAVFLTQNERVDELFIVPP